MTAKRQRATRTIEPRIVVLTEPKGNAYPPGRMLIASPDTIAAIVQRIPRGQVLRLGDLRAALAAAHDANYTCPMTTGIFLRMLAEDVDRAGTGDDMPWWRVVRDNGALLDKLPGGAAGQQQRLERDGITVPTSKSKRVPAVAERAWVP
ncbi:MGMT family protein [Gemmatimonas sp.]|uniref:MGMT family protein n=1 Tax=Gemmatimonas sp. TaxID=1962908 RepID=UPI00334107ED